MHTWTAFADAILRRAAGRRLEQWGRGIDPRAGAVVRPDDVERLVGELPTYADDVRPPMDDDVAAARAALHDDEGDGVLPWLAAAAGLDEVAVEVLALAGALAWSPERVRLLGYVQDDLTIHGLMVASLPSLLERPDDVVHALAPDAPLRRACLVALDPPALTGTAVITVPAAVQWYLVGDESREPDLPARAVLYPGPPAGVAGYWLVHGPDRIRRVQAAAEAVETSRLLVTPEPTNEDEWAAVVRTAVCRSVAVVVEVASISTAAAAWLQRTPMVPWVVATRDPLPLEELPEVTFVERRAGSPTALDDEVRVVLGDVPLGHRLRAEQLPLLARVHGIDPADAPRRLASGALDQVATRIRPRRTWEELVLPPDRLRKIHEVIDRARHHQRVYDEWGFRSPTAGGVVALFAGPPGTGKSMSAEIVAGSLDVDVFRIDLSAVVSKYIGETEKHLDRAFAAAEGGGVLLVFDEADALFGKRTKVADAHDRYANLETSYLLQRIERYEGLTVLTTNLASNIDEAFLRRVHVFVEFPMPGEVERRTLWAASFPKRAPLDGLELDFLAARFPLSGGSIRSVALTAAFAAAGGDTPVGMSHVIYGLVREYEKLGRLVTAEQFGEWTDLAVAQRAGEEVPSGERE